MFLDSRILSQPVPKVSCLYLSQTASVAHFLLFPCCTYLQIVFLPRRNVQQCTFYPVFTLFYVVLLCAFPGRNPVSPLVAQICGCASHCHRLVAVFPHCRSRTWGHARKKQTLNITTAY